MRVPIVTAAPSLRDAQGWGTAAHATVGWDFTHGRTTSEPSDVAIVADAVALYVRFTVVQHAAITDTQTVDNNGDGADDDVAVRLWPGGPQGIEYTFRANPRGTHYQYSAENSNYAPGWTSIGVPRSDGYMVTMRIPFHIMRASAHATWNAQFERDVRVENRRDIWTYGTAQSASDQVVYSGHLIGLEAAGAATHVKPRLGIYSLGELGTPQTGGSTSRMGLDASLPITATTSLVTTLHPDFSNVEIDQQTIAPTTFARFYSEVRPFFAQGSNYYDYSSCYGCPGYSELYTPSIPTPKRGYQLEGKQGPFTFGALDAVGDSRNDNAQSIAWQSSDKRFALNYTRVGAESLSYHDVTNFTSINFNNQHGIIGYAEAGSESGSTILDGRASQRLDAGVAYATKDDFDSFTMRRIGSQWNPIDGYTAVNDLGGYSAQLNRTVHLRGPIQSISGELYMDRYAGSDGFGTNLFDTNAFLGVVFTNTVHVVANIGTSFYRVRNDPTLHPSNGQTVRVDYNYGKPTQSTLSVQAGHYGDGWLTAIDRVAAFRVARRATVTLEAYDTDYIGPTHKVQWLDRAAVNFDVDRSTSMTVGLRKVIGTAAPFPGQALPVFSYGTNVSLAFARRRPNADLFLVYGDASAFSTRPALTLKYVRYLGAERGT